MNRMWGSNARRFQITVVALAIAGAVAGCGSSSSLVNLWKDPTGPTPLRSVLVVSMSSQPVMRRVWEDAFVTELGKRGVSATPSYRLYANAPPDTAELERTLSSEGLDGVISIHRLATESNARYVPGYSTVTPRDRYDRWSGTYHTRYVETITPGHTETDRIVRYEVDVWTPSRVQYLLWSGITETINPTSSSMVNREVSRLIVPELDSSGVIAKKS